MKKPPSRHRSSTPLSVPVRHQFDHAVPTVIHHPEEKMTALARWAHHVFLEPRKYVTWALAIAAGALVVFAIWNWTSTNASKTSEIWAELKQSKTPEDRVDIAKKYPNSPAALWTLLQVASDNYNLGLADMPNNRDVALQSFKKAQALYDEVAAKAPKDSFEARVALMGKARTLEARNERDDAIKQYELLATSWPDSAEAAQATGFAEALRKPEAAAFYKDLFAYAPTKVTLPAMGTKVLNPPAKGGSTIPGKSRAGSQTETLPDLPLVFPPSIEEEKKPSSTGSGKASAQLPKLPTDVFSGKAAATKEKAPR
jgi:tetratricopeptide (TPR) repeat protein